MEIRLWILVVIIAGRVLKGCWNQAEIQKEHGETPLDKPRKGGTAGREDLGMSVTWIMHGNVWTRLAGLLFVMIATRIKCQQKVTIEFYYL